MFKRKDPTYESEEEANEEYKRQLAQLEADYKDAKANRIKPKKQTKPKKVKPIDEPIEQETLKPYNNVKPIAENQYIKKKSWMELSKLKQWYYRRFKPSKTVLINLELVNGNFKTFLAIEDDGKFTHDGKTFVIDNENKYYNLDMKMWCYDYHEQYCLPIRRKIPVSDIKKLLETDPNIEVEHASNPSTLERFITSSIAQKIMQGGELDSWMKQIRLLLVITTLTVIIHLLLFAQKSGMFESVTGII